MEKCLTEEEIGVQNVLSRSLYDIFFIFCYLFIYFFVFLLDILSRITYHFVLSGMTLKGTAYLYRWYNLKILL